MTPDADLLPVRSVVSIAGFRISVFYYDDSVDRTHSIGPDAGWTIIEATAAVVSASFPAMGPALIQIWRNLRHLVDKCRGLATNAQAARPRQDRDLRTMNEEPNLTGGRSPTHHPDEVDGSFHRLYSKGQNGSAVTHFDDHGQPLPIGDIEDPENRGSSLRVTMNGDTASEEIPLRTMQMPLSEAESGKH